MADLTVRVAGMDAFRKELRRVDNDLGKAMGQENKAVGELVAAKARANAFSQGSVAAKAAPSVRATANQRAATVVLGGARYPFALGAEYGSKRWQQFKAWRGNGEDAGYFFWPAIRSEREAVTRAYEGALLRLAERAFPT